MALCEKCRAEIGGAADSPPLPWFDAATHSIADSQVEPTVWRVFELLWQRRNSGWLSTDRLMRFLYDDRPDDPPNDKIVTVYICKLRQRLAPTPYALATKWHEGWMIVDRAMVEVKKQPLLGEAESGVPPPKTRPRGTSGQDKYGFSGLTVGQSRVIENTTLHALQSACTTAKKGGRGTFEAGYDDGGRMRIWRLC